MKALVLADASAWHTGRYISELRRQCHTVWLVSMQHGMKVNYQLTPSRYGEALSYFSHVSTLKALLDELKPDVVNSHFASAYGVMAARCRRRYGDCGALWALTVWGSDILVSPGKSYLHKRRVRYALDSADVILADSTYLAQETAGLTDKPVEVVLWGIERRHCADDGMLKSRAQAMRSRGANGRLKLFMPRPHRALYDNDTLLSAIAPLLQSGRSTVTINSTGELYQSFMRHAVALGVSDCVMAYQPCPRDEYLTLLQEHDIYLSASRSDSSPVSQIESQAVGVFPVCAEHPGLHDLLSASARQYSVFDREYTAGALGVIERLCGLNEERLFTLLRSNRDIVREKAIYENNITETVNILERF